MSLSETELRQRIGIRACQLLDQEDARATEWATACALAGYAVGAGLSQDEFITVVSGSDFAETLARENGRDRTNRLRARLAKAYRYADETYVPSGDYAGTLPDRLRALLGQIEAHEWKGRTKHSDRVVAVAIVSKAIRINVYTLDFSARDLSLAAGVGVQTAQRAVKRLEKLGLLKVSKGSGGAAQRLKLDVSWLRVNVRHIKTSPLVDSYVSHDDSQTVQPPQHPAFLAGALGPNAGLIWANLPDEPVTVADVADRLKLSRSTVKRALRRMADHRLLVMTPGRGRQGDVYEISPELAADALDVIAEEYGTHDWADRKSAEYQKHRQAFGFIIERERVSQAERSKKISDEFWDQLAAVHP